MRRYVIIGGGPAGLSAAEAIRAADGEGAISLFHGEPFGPYYRPALSFFFKGDIEEHELLARPASWARGLNVRVIPEKAARVDTAAREVTGANGAREPFDRLLAAAGADPVKPPWPGSDCEGVFTYRTHGCARRIADYVQSRGARRAVVVGGGVLGVELAENFVNKGLQVDLIVWEPRPLSLLFDESGAELIAGRMKADGANIHFDARVASINARGGHVESVTLGNGAVIAADVVGVAIGVRPAAAWLEGSGIELSNGVVVDERMRTNVEGIYAAGDAAVMRSGAAMIPCRTWLTASWQGDCAGRNMAGGDGVFHEPVFFNASHVYTMRYAVMGNFNPAPSPRIARARLNIPYGHLSVVAENGILAGATLIGDLAPAWALRRAMEHGRAVDAAALNGRGIAALWRALDGEPRFL